MAVSIRRSICAGFIVLACTSCATPPVAPPSSTASIQSDDDAYVVVGIHDDLEIDLTEGQLKDGLFVPNDASAYSTYAPANHRYIVIKAHAGATLGMRSLEVPVNVVNTAIKLSPCNTMLVFHAPAGKVVYLGDIDFRTDLAPAYGGIRLGLIPIIENKMEFARSFLKANYPLLAQAVVYEAPKVFPTKLPCL